MKRIKYLIVGTAAVVLMIWGCAPVDEPLPAPEPGPEKLRGVPIEDENQPVADKPRAKELPAVPDGLRARVEAAVTNVRRRELSTTNAFWTVFHGILGLGPGVKLTDPKTREKTTALGYLCAGGHLDGLRFRPTLLGVEVVTTRDGRGQGHQDQFLAEMAQWNMPLDRKFKVQGKEYTFADFVRHSQLQARVSSNQELSWTILIVAQYYGTNVTWTNVINEKLHFEDIVRYELDAPVETAACGGTHRLFGLNWAYHLHLQKGGKAEGVWKGIPEKTAKYRDLAKRYQNPDGSFSTSYFRSRGDVPDKNQRIGSTGHIVEWLALALSDEELRQQWVQDAVNALSLLILDLQGAPIDSGSMYHAVHGLQIYYARVFDRSFCPPELLVPLPPGWKKV
jgi:hypothetical protein